MATKKKGTKRKATRSVAPKKPAPRIVRKTVKVPSGTKRFHIRIRIGKGGKKMQVLSLTSGDSPIEPDPTGITVPEGTKEIVICVLIGSSSGKKATKKKVVALAGGDSPIEPDPTG